MNIDNNMVFSEKKEELSPITVSIPDGADVIVGQHIYLVVTVKSPQVKSIKSITIDVPNNNIVVKKEEDWKLIDDASGKAIFTLEIDDKLSSNTSISYTVHAYSDKNVDVEGIAPLNVGYMTKRMKKNSVISLNTEIEVLDTLDAPSPIDDPNSKYNVYSGVVTDENNNPLINTQVIISSVSRQKSLHLANITTDPINSHTPELIEIQKRKSLPDFIAINSDESGSIRFRIYSKQGFSGTIDFTTEILGVINPTYAESAYIVGSYESSTFHLQNPLILGILPGGIVRKKSGVKEFKVGVPEYKNPRIDDAIIFLMKDENNKIIQFKPVHYVDDVQNIGGYSFHLSYEKIPFNKKMDFYYIILDFAGNYSYSKKLNVIFEDDSGAGTNPNNGGNTGNGNHCDNGLYNKVDVDSNYEDGKFSLKIKSITLI
ncbi:hypothetical protein J8V57_11515 [Xenorhabdus sp. PB61.4]|uniref:hypothetical protein n=1 Tax=Xenorhabdus sp. PB61.4 TaxID=2788940 RepID=UPI001E57BC57|nr:hypothetical protein [Xenorhabdus sp. PB61.4]MCC8366907.1 hypothetical protein [Xenorhabdus sp. PB61.4]